MSENYKILGGIGYILSLIPFVNLIGGILAGIGWLSLGNRTGDGVFKATGVLMIICSILGLGFVAALFGTIGAMPSVGSPEEVIGILAGLTVTLLILGCVAVVVAIVMFILQIVSFFRAGKKFSSSAFRIAGWLSIVFVILTIIGAGILLVTVFSVASGAPEEHLGLGIIGGIGTLVIGFILAVIVNILAAVGFFTLKVEEVPPPPPPPTAYYQPPPPPPPPSYSLLRQRPL